jgi:site-specific recombinase XerD
MSTTRFLVLAFLSLIQPTQKRVLPTYTTEDAAKVLNYKPRTRSERRLLAILHLIADAGLRIDECLTLPRPAVDYDNCLVTVTGKGSKIRIVPMSLACRAVLFRWSQTHQHLSLPKTSSRVDILAVREIISHSA